MSIQFDDLNTMVNGAMDDIISANIGISDNSPSSVIRTLVQAILSRVSMQNIQIKDVYSAMKIDDAYGDDLDRLVAIFGTTRDQATYCSGSILFKRNEPAISDISIPVGTLVSTLPDSMGKIIVFQTTEYAYLPVGGTTVSVPILASVAGATSVGIGMLSKMNNPIMGIDYVTNSEMIIGGVNRESDESLKLRAKSALAQLGKSTEDGLVNALLALDEVVSVLPLDQNRGVGTSDMSVVCATIPVTQTVKDMVDAVIKANKASGVSVLAVYPSIKYVDITVTLSLKEAIDDSVALKAKCADAITDYVNSLGIGKTLIVVQLYSKITNTDSIIDDIIDSTPLTNVTCTSEEVIRCQSVTVLIDGEVV